ncbi:MAG: hypothetical protein ACRC3B_20945, partial [Bacteroidia bacterium]
MFDELNKYSNNGHFFFERGQTLSKVCNAPEQPGVYYILQLRKGKIQLIYIGASGTISQKGEFSKQLLKGRLNNKQNGVKRQHFFEKMMLLNEIDALVIYWFVTFDNRHKDLPSFVEAVLLQKHFEIHGCLPD